MHFKAGVMLVDDIRRVSGEFEEMFLHSHHHDNMFQQRLDRSQGQVQLNHRDMS